MSFEGMPFHPDHGEQWARRSDATSVDGRPHVPYVYSSDIVIAVNAALATDRPLLLRGDPGAGKSTVARDIALALGRDYLEEIVTSRTTAADLQWRFDAVRRLGDAQAQQVRGRSEYVEPGVLWRAFDPTTAAARAGEAPPATPRDAVVLLDEIDKADPDVPNDLLLPFGEGRFAVPDIDAGRVTRTRQVLLIVTSNGERELAPAFLRRCVALTLTDPTREPGAPRLLGIARAHLAARREASADALAENEALLHSVVARLQALSAKLAPTARRPGTAEVLDALRACVELDVAPGSLHWEALTRALLYKEEAGALGGAP